MTEFVENSEVMQIIAKRIRFVCHLLAIVPGSFPSKHSGNLSSSSLKAQGHVETHILAQVNRTTPSGILGIYSLRECQGRALLRNQ